MRIKCNKQSRRPARPSPCASSRGPDALEQRILQDGELLRQIFESADEMSEPMTADEFIAWLERMNAEPPAQG